MIPVIVESPYAGDIEKNERYARACLADCIRRGEAPFASHLLYTQAGVLDDRIPSDRALGIAMGFLWARFAHKTIVYSDLGVSKGMVQGVENARDAGREVEYRKLGGEWSP